MKYAILNPQPLLLYCYTFRACASYPKLHIVPKAVTDSLIEAVAGFRASSRFPSVVWR